MEEFIRLRQGSLTVDQYEGEFARLSKFARRLIDDPWDKARRFREGLRPELKSMIIATGLRDYNEIYERALAIERDLQEKAAASGSRFVPRGNFRDFGKRPMKDNRRYVPPARRTLGKPSFPGNQVCRDCGRRHGNSPCPRKTGGCFGCG